MVSFEPDTQVGFITRFMSGTDQNILVSLMKSTPFTFIGIQIIIVQENLTSKTQ